MGKPCPRLTKTLAGQTIVPNPQQSGIPNFADALMRLSAKHAAVLLAQVAFLNNRLKKPVKAAARGLSRSSARIALRAWPKFDPHDLAGGGIGQTGGAVLSRRCWLYGGPADQNSPPWPCLCRTDSRDTLSTLLPLFTMPASPFRHRAHAIILRALRRLGIAGLAIVWALAIVPFAQALTPEEATRVGGDLTQVGGALSEAGSRLAAFTAATAKIVEVAPYLGAELAAALGRLKDSRGQHELATTAALGAACLLVLLAAMLVFRAATARWRRACQRNEVFVRGAVGLLVLDAGQWAVFATGAYLTVRFYFYTQDQHALLLVAVLAALVRWLLFMLFLEAALRPTVPHFRLIAMTDRAARQVRIFFGSVTLIGILGISIMPVLLRAGLPIPAGQATVLLQGLLVACGCVLGLWCYHASHSGPERAQRLWLWFGGVTIPLVWLVWSASVVTLEFSAYHSLVYSLRIGLIAYVIHALLNLSAHAHWWVRLVQHSTNAGAVLAISIMLAELWLVERLAIVPLSAWEPIRHSLVTTSITLFVGFVAWRYLDLWTEQRLRAASPGLAPGIDDDVAAEPASRLTTLLPMVRVTVGVAILLLVAFLGLSQLGADLTTLLAGAGVFGLALSFGSQALVRDIVAGIFFMSDDAFRVGEYIDTGRLKGTVERVTMRSVRLRHQNGQIHTIPFGQLSAITNFSRDWQTVKFNLRLARDTDLEKTRKTIKRVGLEMLQDPELGKEFLLPLKLQGMVEISDSALVVRLKFTVHPSNPSVVQREALKRLHRAFGQDGIEFAAGVITVQPAGTLALPTAFGAAAASGSASSSVGAPASP